MMAQRQGSDLAFFNVGTPPPATLPTASATVTIAMPTLTKSIVATSYPSTPLVNSMVPATIGEIFTYQLLIEMPRSTAPNFNVLDTLPAGMSYVSGSASLLLLPNSSAFTTGPLMVSGAVDFNLGTVTNSVSGPAYIEITFDALVDNVASNTVAGTVACLTPSRSKSTALSAACRTPSRQSSSSRPFSTSARGPQSPRAKRAIPFPISSASITRGGPRPRTFM